MRSSKNAMITAQFGQPCCSAGPRVRLVRAHHKPEHMLNGRLVVLAAEQSVVLYRRLCPAQPRELEARTAAHIFIWPGSRPRCGPQAVTVAARAQLGHRVKLDSQITCATHRSVRMLSLLHELSPSCNRCCTGVA